MNTQPSSPNTPINVSGATNAAGSYVPGVCNINQAEIAYRRKSAFVLLAITIAMALPLLLLDAPNLVRLVLFFPVFLTIVCYLQVRYKFCVGYGAAGKQNATEGDTVAQDIVDAAARKLDTERTRKIKLQAALIAAVVTLVLVVIPTP